MYSGRAGIGGAGFVDLFHRAAFCFQLIEKGLHVSLHFHDQHARMYATGARQVDALDFSHADIAEFTLATNQECDARVGFRWNTENVVHEGAGRRDRVNFEADNVAIDAKRSFQISNDEIGSMHIRIDVRQHDRRRLPIPELRPVFSCRPDNLLGA